jgi:hypothetical protein
MEVLKDLISSTESIKESFNLDGTELYGEDGKAIVDIVELGTIEILDILGIKKDCKSSQK